MQRYRSVSRAQPKSESHLLRPVGGEPSLQQTGADLPRLVDVLTKDALRTGTARGVRRDVLDLSTDTVKGFSNGRITSGSS